MARELGIANKKVLEDYIEELQSDDIISSLKVMKEIMNKSFGEENNQIIQPSIESIREQFTLMGHYDGFISDNNPEALKSALNNYRVGYQVIIYFPELKITNSKKLSHIIKDLYVQFIVGKDARMSSHIYGIRTSITRDEYFSNYIHSHLPGVDFTNLRFTMFCTGSGEINQVIALLSSKFDEINFTLVCLHLKNYVIWESLEGNPYRNMSNIGLSGTTGSIGITQIIKVVSILNSALFNDCNKPLEKMFKFTINNSSVIVSSTDDFEKWAANYIMKVDKDQIDRYKPDNIWLLCRKDDTGQYFPATINRHTQRITHQTTPILKFKGQDKFFTVTNQEN